MHKIFYDAQCPICVREMQLIVESSRADVIEPIAIQGNEDILEKYGIAPEMAMTYLHALRDDGVMLSGMPAVRLMYQGFEGFAIVKLGNLPLLNKFADWIYPWFARNRYRFPKWLLPRPECEDGVCYRKPSERREK